MINSRIVSVIGSSNIINDRNNWAAGLIKDSSGGAYSMNLLVDEPSFVGNWSQSTTNSFHNLRNPGSNTKYQINPNLWCIDYIDQLTGLVISKDDMGTSWGSVSGSQWRTRYGWFPITKRHVIGTGHAFTHAAGTWGLNLNQKIPTRLRWRDVNGETVDRIQLHQATAGNGSNEANSFGTDYKDISVAVLDQDLPDSIFIPKIVPNSPNYRWQVLKYSLGETIIKYPEIYSFAFSQEWSLDANNEQHNYWGDWTPTLYPKTHRAMLYLPDYKSYDKMSYRVWGGDSGTPILTVVDGEVMFHGIVSGFSPYYWPDNYPNAWQHGLHPWEWYVNKLIEIADDNAIAMGRMSERTGYTVTVAT